MAVRGDRQGGLRVAGLFAGVGGLELGLGQAGHRSELLCELDPGAAAVLGARFPHASIIADIRGISPADLPSGIDVIAAGFPCQDLSQAGEVAGIDGLRSSLVGEVFRLLRTRRVPWVVLENVPFMLHLDAGRAMERVVGTLEDLGYRWAYRVVDGRAFGLPQRRRRVFVVASTEGSPADVLLAEHAEPREEEAWDPLRPVGFYWTEGNRGVGWAVDAIPTLKGGSGLGIPSPPAVLLPNGSLVIPSIRAAEQLQGFPSGWTQPAEAVVSPRLRWRMVGNAVNVRAARWLGERLATPGEFDPRRLGPRLGGSRWPVAACNLSGERRAVEASEWPQRRRMSALVGFLRDATPLSARATEGFLFRAERAQASGKLRFPQEFLARLRVHLESARARAS